MSHITGLFLIDAPASALNNLGTIEGERYDNSSGVKVIKANDGPYPYVSAQAFRYWLRQTLASDSQWRAAPIYREEKIAYTDANPIEFWDDDLFGYMRAPSKKQSAKDKRAADASRAGETETTDTVTRVAPLRVSTLVSIAPLRPTSDYGVMARQEDGFPVPHEHQFYRTTLKGLFSLNLKQCGVFSYKQKTGYRNLDDTRIAMAQEKGLQEDENAKVYRLPNDERLARVTTLFEGMARLEGGAKQTLHYTDVAPTVVVLAATKGGNHIFGHVIGANDSGLPELKVDALNEALRVFADDLLSKVYVGWVRGYADSERAKVDALAANDARIQVSHPREAYQALIADLKANPGWLE